MPEEPVRGKRRAPTPLVHSLIMAEPSQVSDSLPSDATATPSVKARAEEIAELTVAQRYTRILEVLDSCSSKGKINNTHLIQLREELAAWGFHQGVLEGQIVELRRECDRLRRQKTVPTYAAVAGRAPAPVTTKEQITRSIAHQATTLFLKPLEGVKTEDVQKVFTSPVKPAAQKIKISKVKKTNNTVIVELASKEDSDKIIKNEALQKVAKIEPPKKRDPLLIIYDTPSKLSDEEFLNCIRELNSRKR